MPMQIRSIRLVAKCIVSSAAAIALGGCTSWSTLTTWTHSWDARDAATYQDDGTTWGIPAARRVDHVPDRGPGQRDLTRDQGPYGALFFAPPLPGPVAISQSPMFSGRAAWHDDLVESSGFFAATLSPVTDPSVSSTWFNPPLGYSPPFWYAILGRTTAAPKTGLVDSTRGELGTCPTIDGGLSNRWSIATFGPQPFPWPSINHQVSPDETVLMIAEVASGTNASFLEINWRDASGTLQTLRQHVTVNPYTCKELYFGIVHEEYVSAAAVKLGVPSKAETDAVRNWAAPYIPAAGPLFAG